MQKASCILAALAVAGCSGINIKPISLKTAAAAHADGGNLSGYIVYEPVVVVELSEKEVCVKTQSGECKQKEFRCAVGAPFVLPDYTKPYLVDIRSGLGKAGVEVEIIDGWRLGKAKDASDNTSILGLIEKVVTAKILESGEQTRTQKCSKPGLYRMTIEKGAVNLEVLQAY